MEPAPDGSREVSGCNRAGSVMGHPQVPATVAGLQIDWGGGRRSREEQTSRGGKGVACLFSSHSACGLTREILSLSSSMKRRFKDELRHLQMNPFSYQAVPPSTVPLVPASSGCASAQGTWSYVDSGGGEGRSSGPRSSVLRVPSRGSANEVEG